MSGWQVAGSNYALGSEVKEMSSSLLAASWLNEMFKYQLTCTLLGNIDSRRTNTNVDSFIIILVVYCNIGGSLRRKHRPLEMWVNMSTRGRMFIAFQQQRAHDLQGPFQKVIFEQLVVCDFDFKSISYY